MVKTKIKDLYSPFRCLKLPCDHSEGLIFAIVGWQFQTSLCLEMVITYLLSHVFIIPYHLLECKMVSDRFGIFFFFFYENSLSLSLMYSYKMEALSVLSRPDSIKSFLHHFPSSFGHCSVCRTPAVARVSVFVPYTELPPFEV